MEDYYLTDISRTKHGIAEQTFYQYYGNWAHQFDKDPIMNTFQNLVFVIWDDYKSETKFRLTYNMEKKLFIESLSYDLTKLVPSK